MQIGITQIILPKLSLDQALALCRDAGYEAIELVFREGGDPDVAMSDEEVRRVGDACARAGVSIASVIARYRGNANLLSADPAAQDAGKRNLARALDLAALLGVGATLLHPGQLTAEGSYQQAWDRLLGTLREMAPYAAARRCTIAIENVWNKFLLSPREMREFVDAVDSPWVGCYLDTANMMAYGYETQWIRELGPRIRRVHFKDFRRREHQFVPLLEGDTDWPGVVGLLREIGYDGFVIHEVGGEYELQLEMAARMRRILGR